MNAPTLSNSLIKGLSYNLPIEGSIRMGRVVMRGDKRLPAKDDQFTVTLKYKDRDGWVPHPLDAQLREQYGEPADDSGSPTAAANRKLRKIPVVVAFDNPDLSVSEQYAAFNRDGRQLCRGDGATARRRSEQTGLVVSEECPGPELCEFGRENRCDAFVRAMFHIEGQGHDGSLFVLRSGSFNAVSDLRSTLESCKALFGRIAGMPMWLTLEAKSSSMSKQSAFWYASLRPRLGNHVATKKAIDEFHREEVDAGLDRQAYEQMIVALNGNSGMGMVEAPEDRAQLDDVVVARFAEEGEDGPVRMTLSGPNGIAQEIANLSLSLREGPAVGGERAAAAPTTGAPEAAGAKPDANATTAQAGAQPEAAQPGA